MPSAAAALSRRQLLALGAGGAALLAGCRSGAGPRLLAVQGELPAAWLKALPAPWQLLACADPPALLAAREPAAALVAVGDGWASTEPLQRWQPLGQPNLLARLAPFAQAPSRLFAGPEQAPLAFPWAYSPWVIVLRSRPDLSGGDWSLLLDPSLRGRLVLPSSPRICIALMGGDFERVQQLRRQALAHNDRQGLNLLLSGRAEAAVLPLRFVLPLLRRDPRLQVLWPASGAPLGWQLLLRPAGARQALPADWLAACLEPPLLQTLLAGGWLPPLPPAQLAPLVARFPVALRALLAPDPALLARCWSLPPLAARERLALQTLWDAAAPG